MCVRADMLSKVVGSLRLVSENLYRIADKVVLVLGKKTSFNLHSNLSHFKRGQNTMGLKKIIKHFYINSVSEPQSNQTRLWYHPATPDHPRIENLLGKWFKF